MYKSKRTQYGGSTASTLDLLHTQDCLFCQQSQKFCSLITRALYIKYSASQNYYYQKDINIILLQQRSKQYTTYKEWTYYDSNEYLKRFYSTNDTRQKTIVLTEYYKFHRDIARLFMLPIATTLSKYHDKRRRIEYIRISRMLGGHVEQPTATQNSIQTSLQNLLGQLNFTKQEQSNTLIEIQKNLKEAINTSKNTLREFDSRKYNLPLQRKDSDYYNKSKQDHKSDTNSRLEFKENFNELFQRKKPLKNSAIQTQREVSQPKVYSTEKICKLQVQQIPLTQRNINNTKQSISPRPTTQRSIKPQIMQLLKPCQNNSNKLKATNIILECLMRKLNLDQKTLTKQKSKSPNNPSNQQAKRKRRVMSTNQETSKIDLTQLKQKQSQLLQSRFDQNNINKGYKTGRASAMA
ncbi:unnamed protein product (macronuclear) [Paramecium tetraurelia]|uniref:Uncharacterized protein n=1 Tax=Paramecium tetraurelia TaxID=5888 RepID=A0CJK5_PARTE|nr:uncharacterized protein GSPATT00000684001 [Paramecium tetraurelia]CAK70972.1 unnamed protein product [Paramecium tetraurelia]|eukprot:XP_001438369.1 hypothetical protein (macronuclear) [Paramecium tetraurelia strain d4-2]